MIQITVSDNSPTGRDFARDNPTTPNLSIEKSRICDTNSLEIGRRLVVSESIGVATFAVPTQGSLARHCHIYALGERSFGGEDCR